MIPPKYLPLLIGDQPPLRKFGILIDDPRSRRFKVLERLFNWKHNCGDCG